MEKSNLFHNFKRTSTIKKITFTGMLFSMVILFQFLEKFMPFGETYIKLNFTLLFILPVFYYCGPFYGILVLLLRFAIGPAVGSSGYDPIGLVSHFILFISSSIAILFMYLYSLLFRSIKTHNLKVIFISIATVLSTSIVLTLLNGIFITPLFWYVMKFIPHVSVREAMNVYPYAKIAFFGIPQYWGGIFAVYISGNILKFSLVYIVYFPLSKVFKNLVFSN